MEKRIEVGMIPKDYVCPKSGDIYAILGAINYIGPPASARNSTLIGHYTAIINRCGNWTIYDDHKDKGVSITREYKISPEALVYSKL